MLASILTLLTALSPILKPALAFLAGWLFPSPIQKAQKGIDDVHEVEKKVSEGSAPTSDLDRVD
jgi:hypothetical protein